MSDAVTTLRTRYWHLTSVWRNFKTQSLPAMRRYLAGQMQPAHPSCGVATRHLTLLAWEFPPEVTGGVYRPLSFVRYAGECGWSAEVICGPAPHHASAGGQLLATRIPESVPIVRAARQPTTHPWPLPRIDGGVLNALALSESASAHDSGHDTGGIVLASGPPFANFVAGMWVAKRSGRPLVLDYRDEWTSSPFAFVQIDEVNRSWERRCLSAADLVLFTTQSQLDLAESRFPELRGRRRAVVWNGWEPEDFALASHEGSSVEGPIQLAYLGNLGAMASPDPFLETLSASVVERPELRHQVRVMFVGYKRPEIIRKLAAFPFSDMLTLCEPVPKQQACDLMCNVDGLLLLNPSTLHRYIQGKLYEYLASGTPILLFGSGGEMGGVVSELSAGAVVEPGNTRGLTEALLGLRSHRARMAGNSAVRIKWLEGRQRRVLAHALFSQLDALLHES